MENLNKKINRAIRLSITAIALSGVMFLLWSCNAGGFSAVNLDTFVGVIVALLAIIVTIVLGWQIVNVLDIKYRMQKVSQLEEQLELLKDTTLLLNHNMQSQISISRATQWEKDGVYDSAFAAYNSAFREAILCNLPNLESYLNSLFSVMPHIQTIGETQLEMILRDADTIRQTDAYRQYFQDRYDRIIRVVISKPQRDE